MYILHVIPVLSVLQDFTEYPCCAIVYVPRRNCFSYLFKPDEPYPEPWYVYTHKLLLWCVHKRTRFRIISCLFWRKSFMFSHGKNAEAIVRDRSEISSVPSRKTPPPTSSPSPPISSSSLNRRRRQWRGIACYKNTNNYNYPSFRNTLKNAATRAIRHTIGRRGRNKKYI